MFGVRMTRQVTLRTCFLCGMWLIALTAGCLPVSLFAAEAGSFESAVMSIRASTLKRHVTFLADDALEGREAGSRGGHAAGEYIVKQLRSLKLTPGGPKIGGRYESYFQPFGDGYRNILVLLPGRDPKQKHEYIVVGAHYDHVGYGTRQNSKGPIGYIHNGADDNASGTTGVLEVLRAMASMSHRPNRSILFVFWDAEEKGLLGSDHWISHPTVPLRRVRLTINCDMIGRLRKNRLVVRGIRSAYGLRRFLTEQNPDLDLSFTWNNRRDSDHYPFFEQRIPYLMLYTGKHEDYHRPSDDVGKINAAGMQRIVRLLFRTVYAAAQAPSLPRFRPAVFGEDEQDHQNSRVVLSPLAPRLGVSWNAALERKQNVRLTSVVPDSPASRGGLRAGDRILEFGGYRVGQVGDFRTLVVIAKNPVRVVIQRPAEHRRREVTLQLGGTAHRVGIFWRVDPVEPHSVILTRVIPGSPAAQAGLRALDRIHAVSGENVTSSDRFYDLITNREGWMTMRVERRGRMRSVRIRIIPRPPLLAPRPESRQLGRNPRIPI